MDYAAIVFDMDGVLLPGRQTSLAIYRAATEALLADFDVTLDDVERWSDLVRPRTPSAFRSSCDAIGLPADAAWGYRERAATCLENHRIDAGERAPFADTSVLATLADHHAIGVVSNNRHGTVRHCVNRFPWGEQVDVYRGRFPDLDDFGRRKPNPAYLEWALTRIGMTDAVFVGDRRSDVATAHRAGCDAILVSRDHDIPPGAPEPSRTILSLWDLSR